MIKVLQPAPRPPLVFLPPPWLKICSIRDLCCNCDGQMPNRANQSQPRLRPDHSHLSFSVCAQKKAQSAQIACLLPSCSVFGSWATQKPCFPFSLSHNEQATFALILRFFATLTSLCNQPVFFFGLQILSRIYLLSRSSSVSLCVSLCNKTIFPDST